MNEDYLLRARTSSSLCPPLIEVYNTTTWDCRWSTEKAKTYIEELTQMPRFVGFYLKTMEKLLEFHFVMNAHGGVTMN